jgi:NAD(P)-dependent dehydrogenase (short-subunit alcohol dehydrogenase family)
MRQDSVVGLNNARKGAAMELEGKVAVITGAASGIGRAVATRAAEAGMRVVLADIEEGPLKETEAALASSGADVLAVATDVSSGESVEALRDQALKHFGAVHVVHNNAGVGVFGPVWTVPESDWRWILGVNLWGVIHGIRVFVPVLVEQGEGHVVNTASVAGLTSPPYLGAYNATKHAVVTLSETLYADLRNGGSNVGVSVLCPGFVNTRIHESGRNRPSWAPQPQQDGATSELMRSVISTGMDPLEVADLVIDAVRTGRFYVLPHPHLQPAIEARLRAIVDGSAPAQMNLA